MKSHRAPTGPRFSGGRGSKKTSDQKVSNASQLEEMRSSGMLHRMLGGYGLDATSSDLGLELPDTTRELHERATLSVSHTDTYVGIDEIPESIGRKLMEGVAVEGISDAQTLEEILTEYIDMGEVESLQISDKSSGVSRQWLRFYCGDTEVGFIYNAETLEAIVGDGDINLQQ
jgi:hypothetical protein